MNVKQLFILLSIICVTISTIEARHRSGDIIIIGGSGGGSGGGFGGFGGGLGLASLFGLFGDDLILGKR
jgi:hypothetical protein